MITDIFARRYSTVPLRTQYFEEDRRFFTQAAAMVMDVLWLGQKSDTASDTTENNLKDIHDVLALEVGREYLSERWWFQTYTHNGNTGKTPHKNSYATICRNYLTKMPADLSHGDTWVKERLSFVELAFQRRLKQIEEANKNLPAAIARAHLNDSSELLARALRVPGSHAKGVEAHNLRINTAFNELVSDLNERLRLALYKLTFHNGLIQLAQDKQTDEQVSKPFWSLVAAPTWSNVDAQIKEAIDRRDVGDRTAAFHAVSALESCIKIICSLKGWTHGKEKGAANYIDNLASKKNGQFIEQWEAEMLKSMFSDVRNPFAHGPGLAPMPNLSKEQTEWSIDTAMTWIKSLIRRM